MIRGMGVYRAGRRDVEATRRLAEECRHGIPVDELASYVSTCAAARTADFVWLGLLNPSVDELSGVAEAVGMTTLQVEDALNIRQRAKVEVIGETVFAVCKVLSYVEATSDVETGQVAVFVKDGCVVSVRLGAVGDLAPVRDRFDASDSTLVAQGPLAVLHAVMDVVIDNYVVVTDEIGTDISEVEERVFAPALTEDAEIVYKLKRENLEVRRAVEPLVPWAQRLNHDRETAVPPALVPYFKDLSDHLLRVADQSSIYDTQLSDVLESSRSRIAVQQNADMRTISAYVAMAAVPTLIAAIYGMNFDNMPELHWRFGYLMVIGLMVVLVGILYRAFKKSGWL